MRSGRALYEDAQAATKAAIEEASCRAAGCPAERPKCWRDEVGGDEDAGAKVLFGPGDAGPADRRDAGKDGTVGVSAHPQGEGKNHGYNADTDEFTDLRRTA